MTPQAVHIISRHHITCMSRRLTRHAYIWLCRVAHSPHNSAHWLHLTRESLVCVLVGNGECVGVWDSNLLLQSNQEVAQLGLEDLHALQGYSLRPQGSCRLGRGRGREVALLDVRTRLPQPHH